MQRFIGALSEEFVLSFGVLKNLQGWDTKDLHDEVQLFHFALTWKNWDARIKLNQDAAETPHVNRSCVWNADNDFWCPVKSWLDVGIDALIGKARRTKVDDFDPWLVWAFQQNILRLQVAVDDVLVS